MPREAGALSVYRNIFVCCVLKKNIQRLNYFVCSDFSRFDGNNRTICILSKRGEFYGDASEYLRHEDFCLPEA